MWLQDGRHYNGRSQLHCSVSNLQSTGDKHSRVRVFQDRRWCCLEGADIFLNPFFKWSCCAARPDRWSEDKAGLEAGHSLKSSVCSPCATRSGSCYMMCRSLHSFLAERRHWTDKDGERMPGDKYWGLHTWQNRPIYSIKCDTRSLLLLGVLIWRKYKYSCVLSTFTAPTFVPTQSLKVDRPLCESTSLVSMLSLRPVMFTSLFFILKYSNGSFPSFSILFSLCWKDKIRQLGGVFNLKSWLLPQQWGKKWKKLIMDRMITFFYVLKMLHGFIRHQPAW